jgi:hypothetical protein
MQTNVATGSAMANKVVSAMVTAQVARQPGMLKNLTGPAPQQAQANATLRSQTSPGMPIVNVTDLAQTAGDKVSVDCFNIVGGKPIMGDRNAEGKGEKLTSSSMDVSIDMSTKGVDAGGKMSQKRTRNNLLALAKSQLVGYFPRLDFQRCLVHLAGARGAQWDTNWAVPLSTDADFTEIMVNPIIAPTYNRHYVVNSTDLTQGGLQLGSIASTDVLKLVHLDILAAMYDEWGIKMQGVKFAGDPAADDSPIKGILLVDPLAYDNLLRDATSNNNIRAFQAAAVERARFGDLAKHPLFAGEVGMWNNILVKKIDFAVRFNPSDSHQYVAVADRLTAAETAGTVNASLTAGYQVSRSLFLGAQALANCLGANYGSGTPYTVLENRYNLGRNYEVFGEVIGGQSKLRFKFINENGDLEPTDFGVVALDSAVKKRT